MTVVTHVASVIVAFLQENVCVYDCVCVCACVCMRVMYHCACVYVRARVRVCDCVSCRR
jgi:hypothetical protein